MLPRMKKKPGDHQSGPRKAAELRAAFEQTFSGLLKGGPNVEAVPPSHLIELARCVANELSD